MEQQSPMQLVLLHLWIVTNLLSIILAMDPPHPLGLYPFHLIPFRLKTIRLDEMG